MRHPPGPIGLAGYQSGAASLEGEGELEPELSLDADVEVGVDAEPSPVDGASFFAAPDAPDPELPDRASLESVL